MEARGKHPDRLACLVLAAGGSRRLGRPKALVRCRGRALLLRALDAAAAVTGTRPITLVLGADALRLRTLLRRHRTTPHRIVVNGRWPEGLAGSLRAGLGAVPRGAAAVLILLVDQPEIGAAALRRLIAAWRKRPAAPAAARYAGRVGVPAIVPRRDWAKLRRLQGDTGARAWLREAAEVTAVELPEAGLDLDTPEDLARFLDRTAQ